MKAIDCIPEGIVSRHRSRFENGAPKTSVSSSFVVQAQRFCQLLSLEGSQANERIGVGSVAKSWQRKPPCNPATPRGLRLHRLQDAHGQARAAAPPWVDTPRGSNTRVSQETPQQDEQDTKREIWVEEPEAGKPPRSPFDAKSLIQSLPWSTLGLFEDEDMSESGSVRSDSFTISSFTSPLMAPRNRSKLPSRRTPQSSHAEQRVHRIPIPSVATAATILGAESLAPAAPSTPRKHMQQTCAPTPAGEIMKNFTEDLRDKICSVFQSPGLCGHEVAKRDGSRKQRLSMGEFVVGESSSQKSRHCSRQHSRDRDIAIEKLDLVKTQVVQSMGHRQPSRRGGA